MRRYIRAIKLLALLLVCLSVTACGYLKLESVNPEPAASETPAAPQSHYLDFNDVKIPTTLKLDQDTSYIYETNNFRAGVLGLQGVMDVNDALAHFETNMPGDGWTQVSSFRYHRNILIYTKPDKVCLVIASYPFSDRTLRLEVWVSPMMAGRSFNNGYNGSSPPEAGKSSAPPREETIGDPNDAG